MSWKFWKKVTQEEKKNVKPKSAMREWGDAILFAVVAATLIRWLIMEAYTIPTPSMENSLLVDDYLFVSKFHYGTRTPRTPLQVPLTHQKIWFTNIPSYLTWIQLPSYRLPGFSSVKREDVVVFNVPPAFLNEGIDYPIDLKTNYIKRCVGIPGDKLEVRERQLMVNGAPLANPEMMQFCYRVVTETKISDRNMDILGLNPEVKQGMTDLGYTYQMFLTKEKAEELSKLPYIKRVEFFFPLNLPADQPVFPQVPMTSKWTMDNYGPIVIPKEGMTISINDSTLAFYGDVIKLYDHNGHVEINDGKLTIEGKAVTAYTFKQNYYFMMGDNRHNSLDSRFWGFVPADHIVGKAFFIWLSIDRNGSFFNKIRWRRFFKMIN